MPPSPHTENDEGPEERTNWHKQPLTTIYMAYRFALILFIMVPFWTVKFLIPRYRPSPNWSLFLSVVVYTIRHFMYAFLNAGTAQSKGDRLELLNGRMLRFVAGSDCRELWINPVPEEDVWGEIKVWKDRNKVTLSKVGVYIWGKGEGDRPVVRSAEPDEKIIVHFHGGGYVMGRARPELLPTAVGQLIHKRIAHLKTKPQVSRVVVVEYRLCRAEPLSKYRTNPFPAALLDGLAVIHYLIISLGYHPRNIILSGDSAGGNLALGLTRYLRDAPLPNKAQDASSSFHTTAPGITNLAPGGVMLQSPWCDMASTHTLERGGPNCSYARNSATDIIDSHSNAEGRPYMGIHGYGLRGFSGPGVTTLEAAINPYISPGSLDLPMNIPPTGPDSESRPTFDDYPPFYVVVGGREILNDEIKLTAERIQSQAKMPTIPLATSKDITKGTSNVDDVHAIDVPYPWVTVDEEPEMFHDFICMPLVKKEAKRALDKMVVWVNSLPKGSEYPY